MTEQAHIFAKFGPGPYRFVRYEYMTYQACHGAPVQVGTSCDHCATGIKNVYFIQCADGTEFKVGSTCVEKRLPRAFVKEMRQAHRDYKREAISKARKLQWRREAFAKMRVTLAENPGLNSLLKSEILFVQSIRENVCKWGTITPNQLAAVQDAVARAAKEAAKVSGEALAGRQTVTGEILTIKNQPSIYGTQWKMLVEVQNEDGTFSKAWGTNPASLFESKKGDIVQFTATFKPNGDGFSFFSRPTKATIVESQEEVAS